MKSIIQAKSTYEKTKPLINKISRSEILQTGNKPSSAKGPKRDKLKNLLVTKYMKMFGLHEENKTLNDEVTKFLQREKVNDSDLKNLEKNLARMFGKKEQNNTSGTQSQPVLTNTSALNLNSKEISLPPIDSKNLASKSMIENTEDDYWEEHKSKIDIPKHGDEWVKIARYNKKMFDNDKRLKFQREMENKMKTKNLLDYQLEEKARKIEEEHLENDRYFKYVLKDVDNYHSTEKAKQDEMKRRIMKEKEIRDKQLREDKIRKKETSAKELENDKQLLKKQLELIERDKRLAQEKKLKEKAAYQQLLKDNEEFKKVQLERKLQERESDIKAIEEYSRILDKQEQQRIDYFKKCESRQSDFMTKMVENVVKVNDDKLAREDENITKYLNEKDKQNKMEEERRKKRIYDQNQETRKMLDRQIELKKQEQERDKQNGIKLAAYLQADSKTFEEQEREKAKKVS